MGLQGNPIGAIIWLILNILFLLFRYKLFDLGYASGLKLVTSLGEKISVFTEAASIMGLTVIGALIPAVVKMNVAWTFKVGKVNLAIQKGVLDQIIMPALLPAVLAYVVYRVLAKKRLSVISLIFLIIIFALVMSFLGILKP